MVSAYLSLIGRRRGWTLIRGWALINFFYLKDGRLFEVGANSRLGAYSNKKGASQVLHWAPLTSHDKIATVKKSFLASAETLIEEKG